MVDHHKIRYSRVKNGIRYFEPTPKMRQRGFEARSLGPESALARLTAWKLYEEWIALRKQPAGETSGPSYPPGSIGWAWERYRRTDAWRAKSKATRTKDWDWAWQFIKADFSDVAPSTVQIEHIELLYSDVLEKKGLHTAHRVIKVWRAFWKVMSSMQLCERDADPSHIIRNSAPKGRSATWSEREVAKLAKTAWRAGFRGLAALLAVAWDTQFAPVDCRTLTLAQKCRDKGGTYFDTSRGKTGKAVIGTLRKRTARVLEAYLKRLGLELLEDAPIFRNRSGKAYTADTLGDDFRIVRAAAYPNDTRQLLDIRRSGAVEALAGEVDPAILAAKMGNSIDRNKQLQETYLPRRAGTVRLADEARKRGRQILRDSEG